MKRFDAPHKDRALLLWPLWLPAICFFVAWLPIGFAVAGTSNLQENIGRICDQFVERIEAESGAKTCAVVVGTLFDQQTGKPSGESAQIEKRFFKTLLRHYASRSGRPLFRWRFQTPLPAKAAGAGGYAIPPQARMLQKYGCGFLITGRIDGSGQAVSLKVELVDIISGAVIASPPDLGGLSPEAGARAPAVPTPPAGDSFEETVSDEQPGSGGSNEDIFQETILEDSNSAAGKPSMDVSPPVNAGRAAGSLAGDSLAAPGASAVGPADTDKSARQAVSPATPEPSAKSAAARTPLPVTKGGFAAASAVAPPEENASAGPSKNERGVITGTNFRYEGEIRDGLRWGTGTMVLDSGDKYVGDWKTGMKDGFGIYYYANGDRYEGQWQNDRMNGQGVYYYKSGSRYEGAFKDGLRHGKGVFYFSNGDRWEGEYRNGKKDGPAAYVWASGQSQTEEWENGKQIQ